MKKLLKWGAIGIVILIVLGAVAGSGEKGESQKVGESKQAEGDQVEQSGATSTSYKVGDQVQSGDYIVSVNAVRKDVGSGYIKPKVGFVYIIPNVTVQNNSTDKTTVSTLLQMYVKDSEGNKYTPTLAPDATGKVDGELLGVEKINGDVGFEVPTTATGLKFYYNAAWLTGESIVIDLGQL